MGLNRYGKQNGATEDSRRRGHGTLTPKGVWRELRLTVEGTQIFAVIDGAEVAKVSNARWADGLVGVGAGFHDALYKSLAVGPVVGE